MRPPLHSPFDRDPNAPPLNPLPPVVWALALPVGAIELVLSLGQNRLIGGAGGIGWRTSLIERYGFSGALWDRMIELGTFPPEHLARFLTYPFLHGGAVHAIFVVVFLLAIGKFVGEVFRPFAVLAVFFGASVVGALVYATLLNDATWLYGGYPGVYGLIGAFTYILWVRLGQRGENQARAFSLIGMLLAVQLLFGLIFGASNTWVAEVAGFAAGFALSILVAPGGWARFLARLRQS